MINDLGWDTVPDEIALVKDGVVIGASVVSDYPVLIRAYTEDLDGIEVEACYLPKAGFVERKVVKNNTIQIAQLSSGVFEVSQKGTPEFFDNIETCVLKAVRVYPNPLNSWSQISVETQAKGNVQISIYNLKGQEIISFTHDMKTAGTHSVIWDGKDKSGTKLATGEYLIRVNSGIEAKTVKVMLIN